MLHDPDAITVHPRTHLETVKMSRFLKWIDGSKTNLVSIWTFGAAIFLVMNGIAIDEATAEVALREGTLEFGGALTAASAGLSALRSSNAKIQNAVKTAVPLVAFGIFAGLVVGCAGLAKIDPATGQPIGDAIATKIGNLVGVFAPGTSMLVSGGVSSLMSLMALIGKAADSEPITPAAG